MDVKKENYINKKMTRVLNTVKIFIEKGGNISDIELAETLNEKGIKTSSSTVGRDLTSNLIEYYNYINQCSSLNEEQKKTVEFINEKRTQNKLDGKRKGGVNFSINNESIKDKKGHFKGSKSRV